MGNVKELIRTSFENGEYARWIKSFQRKNPKSISFTNNINVLNRTNNFHIKSLEPLIFESSEINSEDLENLTLLNSYFKYLAEKIEKPNTDKIIISVDNILYELYFDGEYTVVLDIKDDIKDDYIIQI